MTNRRGPTGTSRRSRRPPESEQPQNPFGISVQRYSFDAPADAPTPDITPYVTDISIRLSLKRPWETCNLTLAVPGTVGIINRNPFEQASKVPVQGDWITVRSFRAKSKTSGAATIFFGYVREVQPLANMDSSGVKDFRRVKIECISWLEVLGRNQVYVAPQASKTVGTFFARSRTSGKNFIPTEDAGKNVGLRERLRVWDELVEAVLSGLNDLSAPDALGKSLVKTWIALAAVRVPKLLAAQQVLQVRAGETLSIDRGSYLADQIPVVYNDPSRKRYAPRMTVEPVPGWSIEGIKAINPQGRTTLDILQGMFLADTNMVEFFPTLEPFDQATPEQGAVEGITPEASDAFINRQQLDDYDDLESSTEDGRQVFTAEDFKINVNKTGRNTEFEDKGAKRVRAKLPQGSAATGLGRSLGMNPVLIYRMKPWRPQELDEYVKNPYGPISDRGKAADRVNTSIFRGVTWHRKAGGDIIHGFRYTEDEISDWTGRFDDDDHVNFVTVGLPNQANSAIRFLDSAGLPLIADESVRQVGLRHFQPRWPFWPPFDDVVSQSTNSASKAVDQVLQSTSGSKNPKTDLFASLFTVALQAMQFMGAADRFLKGTVRFGTFSPELRPGMTAEFDLRDVFDPGAGTMTAYVDVVEHTASVDQSTGVITASTTCDYSRGALSEKTYTRQFRPDTAAPGTQPKAPDTDFSGPLTEGGFTAGTPVSFDPNKGSGQ